MIRTLVVCLLALCGVGNSAAAHAEEWVYTMRPGDNMWNVASKYCGSASFAQKILEFNKIGDELSVRPGVRVRIPIEWLVKQPVAAELTSVRGAATLFTPEEKTAEAGLPVSMGNRLTTTVDGYAVVSFADGSTLNVAPETDVLFNVLTAFGDTGMVDTHLRFYRGRATSNIIRRDAASSFRISSPVGTAAVRGTEFRVDINDERSITETLEGQVGFIQATETPIPQGFGAAAGQGGIDTEPLLSAPVWQTQTGIHGLGSSLEWGNVPGAVSYRVTIHEAANPDTPVQEATTQATNLVVANLAPGPHTVAVRGVSARAIEGYDGTVDIRVGTPAPNPIANLIGDRGEVALAWATTATGGPYTVQVADNATFERVLDQRQSAAAELTPQINPGRYSWRVKDPTSDYSEPVEVTVRPTAPQNLSAQRGRGAVVFTWSPVADASSYRVRVSRTATFANVVVAETVEGTELRQAIQSAGKYFVDVVAVSNGVESNPATTELNLRVSPWWWLLLALPLLI